MLFSSKNIKYYAFTLGLVFVASYVADKFKDKLDTNDEYELIRKYLLNDSPLYGFNRPKLWIHSKYEINSRKWSSFSSRNNSNLNQPYLHLTIQSIIDRCGDDFHICLIDDDSFSKLIPNWDIDMARMQEPHKHMFRQLGMMKILYYYGGMVVPNSFICNTNLKSFYDEQTNKQKPFVMEKQNHSSDMMKFKNSPVFIPDLYFAGSLKNDENLNSLIMEMDALLKNCHFSNENDFKGSIGQVIASLYKENRITVCDGKLVGVKCNNGKPVLIDHLMEEQEMDLYENKLGLFVPSDELLKRTKHQWFSVISQEESMNTTAILSKYLLEAVSSKDDYYKVETNKKDVVAI